MFRVCSGCVAARKEDNYWSVRSVISDDELCGFCHFIDGMGKSI